MDVHLCHRPDPALQHPTATSPRLARSPPPLPLSQRRRPPAPHRLASPLSPEARRKGPSLLAHPHGVPRPQNARRLTSSGSILARCFCFMMCAMVPVRRTTAPLSTLLKSQPWSFHCAFLVVVRTNFVLPHTWALIAPVGPARACPMDFMSSLA